MTTIPQPSDLTKGYTATWDAWNRLVKLKDSSNTVAAFAYDGLNRRITKTVGSTVRHFYYSDQWQVLEERIDSATTADRQFVWGLRYVDDLVLQDKSSTRHYALQDANWNVVAMTDDTGAVAERYAYTPYGIPEFLNASFVPHTTLKSDINNDNLYTGRRRDPETGLQLNRNRYYHQQLGRWLSRDPIGYGGFGLNLLSLLEYVLGNPLVLKDPDGLIFDGGGHGFHQDLLLKPTARGDCGGAEAKVQWKLNLPAGQAPTDGWIIQQVIFTYDIKDCQNKALSPTAPVCYYEAWQVDGGKIYIGGKAQNHGFHGSDTFRMVDRGMKTKGTQSITGAVMFVAGYKLNSPPWNYPGNPSHERRAGSLATLPCQAPPAGWSFFRTLIRSLCAEWDCCCKPIKKTDVGCSLGWSKRGNI